MCERERNGERKSVCVSVGGGGDTKTGVCECVCVHVTVWVCGYVCECVTEGLYNVPRRVSV